MVVAPYMNKKLGKVLTTLLSDVKNDKFDLVIVVSGPEGWGKSFLSRGLGRFCAKFLESNFGPEDISFSLDKYINGSADGREFKVNVLDEARNVLNRKRTTSRDNVRFTNYLSECRFKRQVHIICAPSYNDLDSYVVEWRMRLLINIDKYYKPDDRRESGMKPVHGVYRAFVDMKSVAYCYFEKGRNYFPSVYAVRDKWTRQEAFTPEEIGLYESAKERAMKDKYDSIGNSRLGSNTVKMMNGFGVALHLLKSSGFSLSKLAGLTGFDRETLSKYRNFAVSEDLKKGNIMTGKELEGVVVESEK